MANRSYRHRTNYYDDVGARRYPRPRNNNMATIRLLTQGAESIIHESRRYPPQHHEQPSIGDRDWSIPRSPPPPKSSFIGILPLLSKIVVFGTLAMVLLVVSLGEFSLFYVLAMPGLHSNEVLHFDYTGARVANQVLEQISRNTADEHIAATNNGCCQGTNSFDASCNTRPFFPKHISSLNALQNYELGQIYDVMMHTAPIAIVDLFASHDSWEHYHSDILPPLKSKTRVLKQGAPHFVEVILDLPESVINLDHIGMFSVIVDLLSSEKLESSDDSNAVCDNTDISAPKPKLLASSTRTARMPHESVWISILRKVICIVPHLVGAIPEHRRITVQSYRFFVESEEFPLRHVKVRLVGNPRQVVEVTHGFLRIGEELTGFRLILKEWFFVCAAAGTILLFSVQSLLLLFLRLCCCRGSQQQEEPEEYIIFEDESLGLNGLDGSQHSDSNDGRRNASNNNNNNNNSSQQPPRQSDFDSIDDQDEWEPLPQENSPQNTQSRSESSHWIPMN